MSAAALSDARKALPRRRRSVGVNGHVDSGRQAFALYKSLSLNFAFHDFAIVVWYTYSSTGCKFNVVLDDWSEFQCSNIVTSLGVA